MTRKRNAPTTAPTARSVMPQRPKKTPPMSSEASATVTMPLPRLMSKLLPCCAMRQPERAVKLFEMHRPTVVVKTGLMEEERTMSALLPVARMERPSFVLRNAHRKRRTSATAASSTARRYCPAKGVPASAALARVKTVPVLFRASWALLPEIAMLTEYSAELTTMPASRDCTPMRVCSRAVTNPDREPASRAAGSERIGWPDRATIAPTTAPRVKHPSVDRSQTFSIE